MLRKGCFLLVALVGRKLGNFQNVLNLASRGHDHGRVPDRRGRTDVLRLRLQCHPPPPLLTHRAPRPTWVGGDGALTANAAYGLRREASRRAKEAHCPVRV